MRRLCALLLAAPLVVSCTRLVQPTTPAPRPHYVLGAPYRLGGIWHYPHEQYGATLTGLAIVTHAAHPKLTANGETFDPGALAVASRTIQLPAIGRLTDLETGRQVLVRVNDRGPAQVRRLIAVTPRVGSVLGFPPDGIARVRLEVLAGESHDDADSLPGAPHLAIAAAPREAVLAESLDAPTHTAAPVAAPAAIAPPRALSAQVTQVSPEPGSLYVRLSRFTNRRYAAQQAGRISEPAEVARLDDLDGAGYRARLGPFATIADADSALDRALRAGVTDARIVVE
ncbi:MAG: RlpA-like double-psi beta-barrel domain-containing protein [Acetobacteraceae bacterium]